MPPRATCPRHRPSNERCLDGSFWSLHLPYSSSPCTRVWAFPAKYPFGRILRSSPYGTLGLVQSTRLTADSALQFEHLTADQSTILQSRSATIPYQLRDARNAVCAIRRHGKLKCAVMIVTSG